MLAKGTFSVNGKCVLLCTIKEKAWSKLASLSAIEHDPRGLEPPVTS